jgi:glycosyltransferase involved in cell wall biosynthesis
MSQRVVIVHPGDLNRSRPGGIQSFIRGFVRYAPAHFRIDHVGLTADDGTPVRRWTETTVDGRVIRFLPLGRVSSGARQARVPLALRFGAALWRARRLVDVRDGDVLQFHRPGVALPLIREPAVKVQVVHLTADDLLSEHSESRWRLAAGLLRLVESVTLRRMRHVYVVNEEAATSYRDRFPRLAGRIRFISNWVDDATFHVLASAQRAEARVELEAALEAAPTDRLLLFAGRLDEQKQPMRLLEAFAGIGRDDVRLAIAGDGGLRAEVDRWIERSPAGRRIRVLGFRSRAELARLMNGADLLVVSSSHETGPTIAFEALSCGLPVVATPVGSMARLAHRQAVFLASDHSPSSVADAMRRGLAAGARRPNEDAVAAVQPYRATQVLEQVFADHEVPHPSRAGRSGA